MEVGVRLPEKVHPATEGSLSLQQVGNFGMDDYVVRRRDDPIRILLQIHEGDTPLEGVQHRPMLGRERVLPPEGVRHRFLGEEERPAAQNQAGRQAIYGHWGTSLMTLPLLLP